MKLETLKKRLKGFGNTYNMTSTSGREVPNQMITEFKNGRLFKSYDSIIAIVYKGKVYLTDAWDYSRTTGKYRNEFLGFGAKETRQRIKNGSIKILQ